MSPRAKPRRSSSRIGLADQLRDAIQESHRSDHDLAVAAKIAPSIVSRFMRGERGLTLDSLDALCEVLGLRLVGAGARRTARARTETSRGRRANDGPPAPREDADGPDALDGRNADGVA